MQNNDRTGCAKKRWGNPYETILALAEENRDHVQKRLRVNDRHAPGSRETTPLPLCAFGYAMFKVSSVYLPISSNFFQPHNHIKA